MGRAHYSALRFRKEGRVAGACPRADIMTVLHQQDFGSMKKMAGKVSMQTMQ